MRVLLQCGSYPEDGSRDEREIMEFYTKYLRISGVEVEQHVGGDPTAALARCDVAHFFGLSPDIYQTSSEAKKLGKPTLATPSYWNDEYPIHFRLRSSFATDDAPRDPINDTPPLHEPPLNAAYYRRMMTLSRVRQQKTILENASLVFASGGCEKKLLCRDFDLPVKKVMVLPLGVEIAMGMGNPELIREHTGLESFVLCVGELRERKNQHALIEVCRERGLPVVFAGSMGDESHDYSNYCRAIAHDQTVFLGDAEPRLLKSAYQAASAVVQPGLCELPGLPCLSAAVAGCPVVVTERGTAWDYLGSDAFYCDPDDHFSIGDSLDAALSSGRSNALKKNLLEKFSWSKSALVTLNIYNKLHSTK